jgi:hypothetical protein
MATWFAQNNSVNIDSVNQWNSAANGSGSWLTWASLGVNDILVLNGKTAITINVNVTCATITNYANGGTAGGSFIWSTGITITANILAGGSIGSISGTGTRTLIGNLSSSGTSNETTFLTISGGTLNITGNVTGPRQVGSSYALSLSSGAVVNVTGQVWSFQTPGQIYQTAAINIASGCQCTVTGNVYGGPHGDSGQAIINAGTLFITGDVYAYVGYATSAIQNSGICEIIGNLYPSSTGPAYQQTGSGLLYFTGIANVSAAGGFAFSGITATGLRLRPTGNVEIALRAFTGVTVASERRLYSGGTNLGQPSITNVRNGTVYGASNEYTGTLIVPSPSLVAVGVATDNTVGTYNPGLNAAELRAALGLSEANLDEKFADVKSDTSKIRSKGYSRIERLYP